MTPKTHPGERASAPQRAFTWRCDRCAKPILDGHGFVSFRNPWTGGYPDFTDAEQRRYNEEYLKADAALTAREGKSFTLAELERFPQYPHRVRMEAVHRRCNPLPDDPCYWVPVEKIRDLADVLDWVAHLLEKPWFAADEAKALIRKYQRGTSEADTAKVPV